MKIKDEMGEKAKEGGMKGRGYWPSPYPPSHPISSFTFILNVYFFQEKKRHRNP